MAARRSFARNIVNSALNRQNLSPAQELRRGKEGPATAQERSAAPTAEKKASKKRQTAKLPIEVPEAADKVSAPHSATLPPDR